MRASPAGAEFTALVLSRRRGPVLARSARLLPSIWGRGPAGGAPLAATRRADDRQRPVQKRPSGSGLDVPSGATREVGSDPFLLPGHSGRSTPVRAVPL
jgi:hypothetical protein